MISLPLHEALKDNARIEYHHQHLLALQSAIRSSLKLNGTTQLVIRIFEFASW
jgi:beta-glucosidase